MKMVHFYTARAQIQRRGTIPATHIVRAIEGAHARARVGRGVVPITKLFVDSKTLCGVQVQRQGNIHGLTEAVPPFDASCAKCRKLYLEFLADAEGECLHCGGDYRVTPHERLVAHQRLTEALGPLTGNNATVRCEGTDSKPTKLFRLSA